METMKQKIEIVKDLIRSRMDTYIIDANSHYYNELFLREYLRYDISMTLKDPTNQPEIALLYVSVDNLSEINAKYNPQIGDETIQNAGYLIQQNLPKNSLLIRRNGPGYIMYLRCNTDEVVQIAQTIQHEIRTSEVFVEPISASVSSVKFSEIPKVGDADELTEAMLRVGWKRINLVPALGPNAYLDQDLPSSSQFVGRVLLVEHDPLTQKAFQLFFEKNGFAVEISKDGEEALERVKSKTFDAILCEKIIPKRDGFSLKNAMNDLTKAMNTLFILMTHAKNVETVLRANELRIDYVVDRPLILEEILGFIQRELKKRGTYL